MEDKIEITIKQLDQIVSRYGFNTLIVPPNSELWNENEFGVKYSDVVISHDCVFFLRGIATKEFNTKYTKSKNWSLVDFNRFYQEHKIYEHFKWEDIVDWTPNAWYLGDRITNDSYAKILSYRWDNGFAFMDYQARVEYMMNKHEIDLTGKGEELLEQIQASIAAKAVLKGEIDNLETTGTISPRLQSVIDGLMAVDNEDLDDL